MTPDLFNTRETWQTQPLAALAAWLLTPDFVTRNDRTQALRASSIKVYSAIGQKFIKHVLLNEAGEVTKRWDALTASDIRDFLEKHNIKKGIRHRYVRLIERIYDHLTEIGITSINPARGLAIVEPVRSDADNDKSVVLSQAQLNEVFDALPKIEEGKWKSHRDRALIATLIGAGLRVSEVIMLKTRNVKPQADATFLELDGVGAGRAHRVKMTEPAATILNRWSVERTLIRNAGELLFPSKLIGGSLNAATVYRKVSRVFADAGLSEEDVKRRGGRTLRNTFAVAALDAGAPLQLVGEWLGHHADRSTMYYTKLKMKP